jgi:hypothetical protein
MQEIKEKERHMRPYNKFVNLDINLGAIQSPIGTNPSKRFYCFKQKRGKLYVSRPDPNIISTLHRIILFVRARYIDTSSQQLQFYELTRTLEATNFLDSNKRMDAIVNAGELHP